MKTYNMQKLFNIVEVFLGGFFFLLKSLSASQAINCKRNVANVLCCK